MYHTNLSIFEQNNNEFNIETKSFNIVNYYLEHRDKFVDTINEFDCTNKSMNLYLHEQAIEDALSFREEGCTTIVVSPDYEVYGYYTVVPSQITFADDDICPSLHVSRLATSKHIQGQGLGIKLIKEILNISKQVGYRFITLDSMPSKVLWYIKRGFTSFEDLDMNEVIINAKATDMYSSKDIEVNKLVYMYKDLMDHDVLKDFYLK